MLSAAVPLARRSSVAAVAAVTATTVTDTILSAIESLGFTLSGDQSRSNTVRFDLAVDGEARILSVYFAACVPHAHYVWALSHPGFKKILKKVFAPVEVCGYLIKEITFYHTAAFGNPANNPPGFCYISVGSDKYINVGRTPTTDGVAPTIVADNSLVLIRNDAVSVLVVAMYEGKLYFLTCKQRRMAYPLQHAANAAVYSTNAAEYAVEAVAGMIDPQSGAFSSVVAKEMQEELGLVLNAALLVEVGQGVMPSMGGCSETIHEFIYPHIVWIKDRDTFRKLTGTGRGVASENECVFAKLMSMEEVHRLYVGADGAVSAPSSSADTTDALPTDMKITSLISHIMMDSLKDNPRFEFSKALLTKFKSLSNPAKKRYATAAERAIDLAARSIRSRDRRQCTLAPDALAAPVVVATTPAPKVRPPALKIVSGMAADTVMSDAVTPAAITPVTSSAVTAAGISRKRSNEDRLSS